jgi:hypothetical protein
MIRILTSIITIFILSGCTGKGQYINVIDPCWYGGENCCCECDF